MLSEAIVLPAPTEARSQTDLAAASDDELMQAIQKGTRPAFAELVRRHARRYYRLAYRVLGDRREAEDMVQDAFLKLWQAPQQWRPKGGASFKMWFYRVVLNHCLDYKKKRRPLLVERDWNEETETIEEDVVLRARRRRLESCTERLPQRQQDALNLCFYEGLRNGEAAHVMGISVKALESLLVRAKRNLKRCLNEERGERI